MRGMLHVLNGDSTRYSLQESSVPGPFAVWADALHEGPVPANLSDDQLTTLRASYFAELLQRPEAEILEMARRWNSTLERYPEFEEVVFWLEHDLFDQLILLRHLDWLSRIDRGHTRFSLICIGSFPGVPDFSGLGMLSPKQLETLLELRRPVTEGQVALGREAWALFRASDPRPLVEWARGDLSSLPFVPGALQRLFEDYPSTANGLSRSERQMLTALKGGPLTFGQIFTACQRMEERVFMGDTTFWSILRRLGTVRNPLVTFSEPPRDLDSPSLRITLDDLGDVVLDGGADHVELNGIERWCGGVQLSPTNLWRWDPGAHMLLREE
jgi:hypothetical protein